MSYEFANVYVLLTAVSLESNTNNKCCKKGNCFAFYFCLYLCNYTLSGNKLELDTLCSPI